MKDYLPDPNNMIFEFDDTNDEKSTFQNASLDYQLKCVIEYLHSFENMSGDDYITCEGIIDDASNEFSDIIYRLAVKIKKKYHK